MIKSIFLYLWGVFHGFFNIWTCWQGEVNKISWDKILWTKMWFWAKFGNSRFCFTSRFFCSFRKQQNSSKKVWPPPFSNFLPCLPEPSRKVYIPVFQGAGDWKINLFLWIYFFLFFWKTRKTREIVSLEVGLWKIDKKLIWIC